MLVKIDDADVIKMGQLAVMASSPMGLGHFHFDPNLKEEEEVELPQIPFESNARGLFIDYFQGRMVKFRAWKKENGRWEFPDEISSAYESWVHKYPSYQALIDAAKK